MFLDTLAQHTESLGDKTALQFIDGPTHSYAELGDIVNRCANYLLELGIEKGDRLAVQLPKCLPFITLHLASMQIGGIFLPLNPAYPLAEMSYFLQDAGAKVLISDQAKQQDIAGIRGSIAALEQTHFIDPHGGFVADLGNWSAERAYELPNAADQTALMLYTSGTTSRPKGAKITHGNLTANISALHQAWGWRSDDVLLHVLPIFHVHGLVVALHGALHAGATAVLTTTFDVVGVLDLLGSGGFSVFMGVPTMHRRLYQQAGDQQIDLSHMRLLTSGSDRLPDDLFFGYQKTFKVTLLERYGMTETGMNLSNPLQGERRVGSVGMPLPGVSARIVDRETGKVLRDGEIGELQIKGDHVFAGYWQQPEKTADAFSDDGWLQTGDLAMREADGYYTLKGRAKDLIISGGLNIYPPEVELVLMEHSAVAACAVIGCPNEEWGEQLVAVIVPRPGHQVDADEICAFCRGQLAAYKVPRRLVVAQELPSNALGKVQKAKLREGLCGSD